jgi:hypothetical protein
MVNDFLSGALFIASLNSFSLLTTLSAAPKANGEVLLNEDAIQEENRATINSRETKTKAFRL